MKNNLSSPNENIKSVNNQPWSPPRIRTESTLCERDHNAQQSYKEINLRISQVSVKKEVNNSRAQLISVNQKDEKSIMSKEYQELLTKISDLKIEFSNREKNLTEALLSTSKEVEDLKAQLTSVLGERDQLKTQLNQNLSSDYVSKSRLESVLKKNWIRTLQVGNDVTGVVLNGENIKNQLNTLRDTMLANSGNNVRMPMGYGIGNCESSRFPSVPRLISSSMRTNLSQVDNYLGKPGVNVLGLLEILPNEAISISKLLKSAPTNVIWFNVSTGPMVLKITSEGVSNSWTINPGFGISLGKRQKFKEAFLSRMAMNLDTIFEDNIIRQKSWAMYLTRGTEVPGSRVNALNVKTLPLFHIERIKGKRSLCTIVVNAQQS